MKARTKLRGHPPADISLHARQSVDDAKQALVERGPVWWTDGSPDYNRKMAKNMPYAAWFASLLRADLSAGCASIELRGIQPQRTMRT